MKKKTRSKAHEEIKDEEEKEEESNDEDMARDRHDSQNL